MIYAVDIAQARDFPAEVILSNAGPRPTGGLRPVWRVRKAGRLPRGLPYEQLATRIARRILGARAAGEPLATIIDATGIGRAVVEAVRSKVADLGPDAVVAATWSGGHEPGGAWPNISLPKSLLIEHTQTALENGGLDVPPHVPGAADLLAEMDNYTQRGRKIEAARGHDDLVSALLMGIWLGDNIAERELRNVESV